MDFKCQPTFPVRHAVKEAPGRLGSVSTPDKRDVVRGLDTDHGHQLHVDPDKESHYVYALTLNTRSYLPRDGLCRLFAPARGSLQLLLLVVPPLLVLVGALQTLAAVGGARQPRVVTPEAGGALPLSEDAADDALPRRGDHHVRHVQQLGGQHSVIQLELATKSAIETNEGWLESACIIILPWHLKDQH